MVGQRFISRRDDVTVMQVVEHNEKFNTVIIEYLEGDKAGTKSSITTSTLKRWWKKIEVQEIPEVVENLVDLDNPVTEEEAQELGYVEATSEEVDTTDEVLELLAGGDSKEQAETPIEVIDNESELTDEEYAKIGLEMAEQAKKKAKEHKKSKKVKTPKIDRTEDITKVDTFIQSEYECSYCESVKCFKLTKSGKTFAEVYPRRKNIEVRVKTVNEGFNGKQDSQFVSYKDGYKYYLPVHYFISYETDYVSVLEDLLS